MRRLFYAVFAALAMVTTATHADEGNVTLINVFEVPNGSLEASIEFWKLSRDFLKTQPGYVSTKLHQSISPDAKYMLVNVAVWESAEAFRAASSKMMASKSIAPVEGLQFIPGLYTVIETDW